MDLGKLWKKLWATWDLRAVILISLFLQILLIFAAPLRKRVSKVKIYITIWLAYLLADITANFAVGLISKSQDEKFGPFANPDLLAFWAPFLLVHLGGPDTITAFALEDNELWLRHLLGLGFECWAVAYAFFQTYPFTKLWLPTVLMFMAGIIKYTERTRALYLASSRRFKESLLTKPDPGPNYAKLMDEYTSKKDARLPTKIEMIPEPIRVNRIENPKERKELTDLEVLQRAFKFFETFKGLISDLIFSFRERNHSRDFFLKRSSKDAFKVVEVELNFFYQVLYTKSTVVQDTIGYLFRFLSFNFNCAAFALFKYYVDKKEFKKIDIGITYTLLVGAIALDLVAFTMVLYSDWTAVTLASYEHPNWFIKALKNLLMVDRERWPKEAGKKSSCFLFGKIMQLRWSESLSKYNLIHYCLHPRSEWWENTIRIFGLTNMLDGIKYVEPEKFTDGLRDLIFEELKMKSELADDLETAKEIFSARGDWILRFESCTDLLRWVSEVDFDESLIMWHIATELCYNTGEGNKLTNNGSTNATNPNSDDKKNFRDMSKLLSDYMLYLLISQATMLSTVAGIGQIRFRDTCAEAKKFFLGRKIGKSEGGLNCCRNIVSYCKCFCDNELEKRQQKDLQKQACDSILAVNTVVEPVAVKGDRSKSILFDACMLAKELKKIESTERMWEIISKVWVELLSYGASHCRANTHAAQLSKGGQLLTLVWLLMAHLGLGNQFQISEGHARAKLIVRK
ncbi:hypothetical protein Vadar_008698 [Vaccinium darrowii]|uniref:Uncharacterized protein n=1 Tax=Vaccinium darrowii TaxID=229202 RepID=A0ACB7X909_9ERIC|nr:hypothetical protein Vadar_008698 [Vaccinium darrowii]